MPPPSRRIVTGISAEGQAGAWLRVEAVNPSESKVVMSSQEAASAVVGLAASLAILVDPVARIAQSGAETWEKDAENRAILGGELTEQASLAAIDPDAEGLVEAERYRRRIALAVAEALHTFATARVYERGGAGLPVAPLLVGGAVVLVGYAVHALIESREQLVRIDLEAAQAARRTQIAADLAIERLREWRRSGNLPPPTEQERAEGATIAAQAQAARRTLGDNLEGASRNLLWATAIGAALYLATR